MENLENAKLQLQRYHQFAPYPLAWQLNQLKTVLALAA